MFRITILIFILFFVAVLNVSAQPRQTGKVEIVQDERIPGLIDKHIYLNENGKLEGYRVQIFFDSGNNSKNRAFAKKGQFLSMFPNVGAYLTFQSPNYKVRVGDFRTRLDAEGFKARIIMDFTDAFVVMDEINYPSLEE
jgi:hypothetical protein